MTHCKIRLGLGSAETQNQSIFYCSYNMFILFHLFQGFFPPPKHAKSQPTRQLALIVFQAQKPEMRQLHVNCASGWHGRQFHSRGIIHNHLRCPSCRHLVLIAVLTQKVPFARLAASCAK